MLAGPLQTWSKRPIAVRQRLERICASSLLFLMVATTKHSFQEAARFSGLHTSLFSHLLKSHAKVAISTLEQLSKTQARQFAKVLQRVKGLPWKIVILIDSTLLRIPVIPATQSGAKLPLNPKEACHPIRTKAAPHRSPIGVPRRLG